MSARIEDGDIDDLRRARRNLVKCETRLTAEIKEADKAMRVKRGELNKVRNGIVALNKQIKKLAKEEEEL